MNAVATSGRDKRRPKAPGHACAQKNSRTSPSARSRLVRGWPAPVRTPESVRDHWRQWSPGCPVIAPAGVRPASPYNTVDGRWLRRCPTRSRPCEFKFSSPRSTADARRPSRVPGRRRRFLRGRFLAPSPVCRAITPMGVPPPLQSSPSAVGG